MGNYYIGTPFINKCANYATCTTTATALNGR